MIVLPCTDLDAAITTLTGAHGFRLDMIMPADSPRIALLSGHGQSLRLESTTGSTAGRAGMHYRDLVPGRLDGQFIASLIAIPDGGPVPDYVHYHQVRFQIIYCRRGWVRVVYEDQGPDFVMQAGDCVLQPPTIRHRVLEASPGLEVIELGGPAEHETWREHGFDLPTANRRPDRSFGGQRFVRHVAAEANWQRDHATGLRHCDLGLTEATDGLVRLRVLEADRGAAITSRQVHSGELLFMLALDGEFRLVSDALRSTSMQSGDACVVPTGDSYFLELRTGARILELVLPAQNAVT